MRFWKKIRTPIRTVPRIENQKGQATIMIATMIMTLVLLFAFTVNTGMLVNAKINLQNAADVAAYAGAATQARQLNDISYLNYEMRRQYKKFLFRYYVVGSMSQKNFPRGAGGSGAYNFSPDGVDANAFGVPAVCFIFNSQDNFCQKAALDAIPVPKGNPMDSISGAVHDQLANLEKIRQESCLGIGQVNQQVLIFWLFNADPSLSEIEKLLATSGAGDPEAQKFNDRMKATLTLSRGLGVIPKLMILRQRIKTLQEYLNATPQTGLTLEKAGQLKTQGDVAARERSIQAFYSAYYTLGPHTFNSGEIQMDELLPTGSQGADLLALQDIKAKFDTFAVDARIESCEADPPKKPNKDDPKPCVACPVPVTMGAEIPVGVYKEQSSLTFYALRIQAKAKVLFSPFGDMQLKAYAAAQPFGSRIGPALDGSTFAPGNAGVGKTGMFCGAGVMGNNCTKNIPNLPIKEGDSSSTTGGWFMKDVLGTMFSKFNQQGTAEGVPPSNIGDAELSRAYQAAMAPNPVEKGQYNILSDAADPFVQAFEGGSGPDRGIYSFWAPITSPDKQGKGDLDQTLKEMVDGLSGPGQANLGKSLMPASVRSAIVQSLTSYFGKLREGKGEDGEGFHIARLRNPYRTLGADGYEPITLSPDLMLNAKEVKTSWSDLKDGNFATQGRTGYSVKFVSFQTLREKDGVTSDGKGKIWTNTPAAVDGDAGEDMIQIRH